MLGELIGTIVEVATNYIILSTLEGKKRIPYKSVEVSYGGLALQGLLRKKVKITFWDKVTIEISSPKN